MIKSGLIVDGSGASPFTGDVAVLDGRITAIGIIDAKSAREVIDASGLIIAPGFIDMMVQTATPILENAEASLGLLTQGITTINACGGNSAAPTDPEIVGQTGWRKMSGYLQALDQKGLPINVAQTIGHNQIRRIVMGEVDRSPTNKDLRKMQDLVKEAMDSGAIGISTALNSPPAMYAQTEEIAALARVAGKYGGGYFTELRSEGDHFLEALEEAITIGKIADVPVHISQLQATGKSNWHKLPLALKKIESARDRGEKVSADICPSCDNPKNSQNNVFAIQQEYVSFSTGVGLLASKDILTHPRSLGAFRCLFSHYVRDLEVVTLEQAVSQSTAIASSEIMAKDRGHIAIGSPADLIVFDDEAFQEASSLSQPQDPSKGMKYVLVNGVMALRNGKLTGNRSGMVLRGPGYQEELAPQNIATGATCSSFAKIDSIMKESLAKHHIPGASLAITDQGRLVYSRGFGYADLESQQPVTPTTLFRIASLAKPITAVAIMKLVESELLDLDTPVFSVLNNYEPFIEQNAAYDVRLRDITVRYLLQHRGGWDREVSFDPMFRSYHIAASLGTSSPATHDEIIRYMLGKPLDFNPGERYAYSNFGYCLLGRVIEKLSGCTYENYVKKHVLEPLGITDMEIGRTAFKLHRSGESRYYDPHYGYSVFDDHLNEKVPQPYGAWHLEVMDSHGGWIATAEDLLRFATAFDRKLLSSASVEQMFERPPGLAGWTGDGNKNQIYYGLGWQVRTNTAENISLQMHAGSLPGTSTIVVRRSDGRCFALLFNARESPFTSQINYEVFPALNEAIDEIGTWPTYDLFCE
ncbi:serine hydrolase [Bythopirellula goksoeyrii]|uniref:serine hydrolase n=1 Tax=Bythopirellula goksoeyrii TaxID=1400387 RepID=UPI00143D75DD|nr:serine hydrolase [Bythopirellula goksoeyrii]